MHDSSRRETRKPVVEMLGGDVYASSDGPDSDSESTIREPRSSQASRTASPGAERKKGVEPISPRHVLVIDDNVDAADTLALLLRIEGHDVRVAHGGPEALAILDEFQPQLILLDIGMPGMDGFEVARRLAARPDRKSFVVVAMTGFGQQEDREKTAAAGFDCHLVKPVEYDVIRELLRDGPGKPGPESN